MISWQRYKKIQKDVDITSVHLYQYQQLKVTDTSYILLSIQNNL